MKPNIKHTNRDVDKGKAGACKQNLGDWNNNNMRTRTEIQQYHCE